MFTGPNFMSIKIKSDTKGLTWRFQTPYGEYLRNPCEFELVSFMWLFRSYTNPPLPSFIHGVNCYISYWCEFDVYPVCA